MKANGWIDRVALAAMLGVMASTAVVTTSVAAQGGPAAAKYTMPGGIERRFFTSGPLGLTTYRVDVDASGKVLAREQVLTDSVFQDIRDGATDAEVAALIGPPSSTQVFHRTKRIAWNYHYRDTWGYDADFAVLFDTDGRVVGKFSMRDSG